MASRLLKMKLAALFTLSISAWGACSNPHCSAIIPATTATATITGNGMNTMRLEFRLWGPVGNWANTNNTSLLSLGGFQANHLGASGANLLYSIPPDTVTGGFLTPIVAWTSDMTVRFQRNVNGAKCDGTSGIGCFSVEVYDTQTGVSIASSVTTADITALANMSTSVTLGSANAFGNIGFLRYYSTAVPIGTRIPVGISTPADLGDWEWSPSPGSPNDTSGNGANFTGITTIAGYSNTPTYFPVCNAGTQFSVNPGQTISLDGSNSYPLDGGSTLTYAWSYFIGSDGVNQSATFSNPNIVNPVMSHLLVFGSADAQLIVTDGSMNPTTCSNHSGVVIADGQHIVNLAGEGVDSTSRKIIGPLIQWGKSPWGWADSQQKVMLDQQIGNVTTYYTPIWRSFQSGTVKITGGSSLAVGSGTDFQNLACGTAFSTTSGSSISSGINIVVTPASMTGILVGSRMVVDTLGSGVQETVVVGATTSSTFTTTFANSHSGSVPLVSDTTLPINNAVFLLQFGSSLTVDGRTHYLAVPIASCTDATNIVLSWQHSAPNAFQYPLAANLPATPYPNCDAGCSGLSWLIGNDANGWTTWIYNAAPGNYYDAWVKAAYAMHLRSGIDTYYTMFTQQADIWWENPQFDQGYACYDGIGADAQVNDTCWPGRSRALAGMVLRALQEGGGNIASSPKIGGLRVVWDLDKYQIGTLIPANLPTGSIDGREYGYYISETAVCAMTDTGGGGAGSSCEAVLNAQVSTWSNAPFARTDATGTWYGNFQFNQEPGGTSVTVLGGSGSVCLLHGQTGVTYVGGAAPWLTNNANFTTAFWTFPYNGGAAPADNSTGDPIAYAVVINTSTTATISPAYMGVDSCTGTSGTNRGFAFGYPQGTPSSTVPAGFAGWGTQPYGVGMLGTAFGFAAMAATQYGDLASAATWNSDMDKTVQWLKNTGYLAATGGLYNGMNYAGCAPPVLSTNQMCYGAGTTSPDSRSLAVDIFRTISMDYQVTQSPTVKTFGDTLMNNLFAKPGTCAASSACVSDGTYLSTFENGGPGGPGAPPLGTAPKWEGQFCGYEESCDMWAAVRISAIAVGSAILLSGGVQIGAGVH